MQSVSNKEQVIKLFSHHFPTLATEIPLLLQDPIFNRALGSIYGSFIGDALGSYVEFQKNISQQLMGTVMKMPGGGTWGLNAGQVTDDSELALSLGYGLCSFNKNKTVGEQIYKILKNISLQYIYWMYKGKPFDIGNTTSSAISQLSSVDNSLPPQKYVNEVLKRLSTNEINKPSCSNGSLMRITPMCAFKSFLYKENLSYLIRAEIHFTHPNLIVVDSVQMWINLVADIINRQNDSQLKQIYENITKNHKSKTQIFQWIQQSKKDKIMNFIDMGGKSIGWMKIAWTQGLHYLRKIISNPQCLNYKSIIKQVIHSGGDTDTNACIVGGLIGSILGVTNLPIQYLKKSLELDLNASKVKREQKYHPKYGFSIAYKLYKQTRKQ